MFVLSNTHAAYRGVATLVAVALALWTLGVHMHQATAANIVVVSDLLTDSAPNASSSHTIVFTTPTGVVNGGYIEIEFTDGPFINGAVDHTDVDIASTTGDFTVAANCGAADEVSAVFTAGPTLTLTFCPGDGGYLSAGATTTIEIGTNATADVAGDQQLTNPGTIRSYEINIDANNVDSGATRVAVVDTVTVTAQVDTSFDFTVSGLATSTVINGTSTSGSSTAIALPFGQLTEGEIKTLGQRLNVQTNARNGFVVTVEQDQNILSSTGADIDGFADGSYNNDPTGAAGDWASPIPSISEEDTWGHWGLTSADDLNGGEFQSCNTPANGCWVAASTTPRQIFHHDGPADNATANIGSTTIGYQIEISALQEAADDYITTLTYIATPTF